MIFDIIPYLIVFIIIIYGIKYKSKYNNNIIYFSLFVFSAFRYDVGFDYLGYLHTIVAGKYYEVERYEIGQRILLLLSRNTFTQLFFIINSLICIYFFKFAIDRLSPNIAISALAFFCFPNMFLYSMGVVRYSTALALVFYASTFLKKKQIYHFLFFQMLALLFHSGAIVGILFVPLYYIKIPKCVNMTILIIGFIGGEFVLSKILSGIFPENVYGDKLLQYANLDVGSGMNKIPYLFLFFDLLVLFGCGKLLKRSSEFYQTFSIYNCGVALMFLFSFQNTLSIRLSLPFLVYSLIIVSYVIQNEKSSVLSRRSKIFLFEFVCFILLIYTITIVNATLGKSQYLPYRLFFFS